MNFVQEIWRLAFHYRFLLFLLIIEKGFKCIVWRIFHKKSAEPDGRRRILVIRTDEIGDFFLWLPFGRSLRNIYPVDKYELVLLGNRLWLDAAKAFLPYDGFIEFDKKSFNSDRDYFMSIYAQLRNGRYDVLIQPRISRFLLLDDLLFIWSGAKESWCFRFDYRRAYSWKAAIWMRLIDLFYSHKVNIDAIENELERDYVMLTVLAGNIQIQPDASIDWDKLPSPIGLPEKYFIVLPGAGQPYKIWPLDKYVALVRKIIATTGWDCVVCGSVSEFAMGEQLNREEPGKVFNVCGKTDILTLAAVIKRAQLLIGNDTGGIHLAALLQIPSVVICGLGAFNRFFPYSDKPEFDYLLRPVVARIHRHCAGCEWHCKFTGLRDTAYPCVAEISVAVVYALVGRHATEGASK